MTENQTHIEFPFPRLGFRLKLPLAWVWGTFAVYTVWMFLSLQPCLATENLKTLGPDQRQAASVQTRGKEKEVERDSWDLELGKPQLRELAAAERHLYRLKLRAGQFALLIVDPKYIELVLTVVGPKGDQIVSIPCPYGTEAAESIYLIAREPGSFRLAVKPAREFAPAGRYELKVAELRTATQQDRERANAQRFLTNGYQLLDAHGDYRIPPDHVHKILAQFKDSRRLAKQGQDVRGEGLSLAAIGVAYRQLGDWQKAANSCNGALSIFRELKDRRNEALIEAEIGRIFDGEGDSQKAIASFHKAILLFETIDDRRGMYNALLYLGDLYRRTGDMTEALRSHTRALDLSRELNNGHVDAEAFTDIGVLYSDMGESQKALEYYTKSLSVDRSAALLSNMGLLYVDLGEIQKALGSFRESLLLYEARRDRGGQALIFNNIGLLYLRVGDNTSALNSFIRALPLVRAVKFRYGEGVVLNNLGKAYSARGQSNKALGYFNEALVLDREVKNRIGEGVNLATIGDVYATSGDPSKGLDFYGQALRIFETSADQKHEASALIHMGRAYEQSGDMERGLECYQRALSIAVSMGEPYLESAATYGIAHVDRNRGDLTAALAEIQSALKIVETLRIKVLDQDLRVSYSASIREYYELCIDLLMQLERNDPTKGYAAKALEMSERSRARGLIEILQEARANVRRGIDPQLLEREKSTRQLLEDKTERQMRFLTSQQNEQQASAIKQEIEELLARYQEVESEIRATSPSYAGLTQLHPFDLARIQKEVLDTDTVLLEYSLGAEHSYLWAVTADSLVSFQLPKGAEVEAAARRVYGLLTERNRKITGENAMQRRARLNRAELESPDALLALSQMVLGPVATLIPGKRLAIVAEGALQYVPFAVLPLTAVENDLHQSPLVVEHEIDNLPSASVLALSRNEMADRAVAQKEVAVFADPVFERGDTRVKAKIEHRKTKPASPGLTFSNSRLTRSAADVEVRDHGHLFPRLVFTRQEAKSILGAAQTQKNLQALDFNANRQTATNPDLSQYRMIHFATHGLLDSEHPELSGLVLSLVDDQGRSVNGFLDLEDIYNLHLSAELVTLSACETGLGKEVKGEGLIGLTRGFMYAGARRVVASLWKVDDVATAELMGRFYRGMLKEGLRPVAALRQAQTEMQEQKHWADPYFWAAFTIQGEWR